MVLTGNWSDCLVLLQQGDVQAFSTDDTILGGIEAEDLYLKLAGDPFSYEPHGLAFPLDDLYSPNDTEFISFANGVLLGLESPCERVLPGTAAVLGCQLLGRPVPHVGHGAVAEDHVAGTDPAVRRVTG